MAPLITPLENDSGEHRVGGETQDELALLLQTHTHSSRKTSIYFPKRLELSFRSVLAFPKDSSRGAASSIYRVFRCQESDKYVENRTADCSSGSVK